MKRIIVITIIVFLIAAAGAGIYYFFFLEDPESVQEEPRETAKRVEPFIQQRAVSPNLSFSGETLWFFDPNGNLFSMPVTGGTPQEFALPPISGFVEAFWQEGTSSFIIRQSLEGHTSYAAYDAEFRNIVEYPDQVRKPGLLGDGQRIVYEWRRGDGVLELKTADLTSENFTTITELIRDDYQIVPSPLGDKAVLFTENQEDPTRLFLVDLSSGEFTDLSNPRAYQGIKFSPDGRQLLALRWDFPGSGQPNLYVHDLENQGVFVLESTASIDQTAWGPGGDQIYIADSAGISRIDIQTGTETRVIKFPDGQSLDPASLLVHPSELVFFFINKNTSQIHKAEVK